MEKRLLLLLLFISIFSGSTLVDTLRELDLNRKDIYNAFGFYSFNDNTTNDSEYILMPSVIGILKRVLENKKVLIENEITNRIKSSTSLIDKDNTINTLNSTINREFNRIDNDIYHLYQIYCKPLEKPNIPNEHKDNTDNTRIFEAIKQFKEKKKGLPVIQMNEWIKPLAFTSNTIEKYLNTLQSINILIEHYTNILKETAKIDDNNSIIDCLNRMYKVDINSIITCNGVSKGDSEVLYSLFNDSTEDKSKDGTEDMDGISKHISNGFRMYSCSLTAKYWKIRIDDTFDILKDNEEIDYTFSQYEGGVSELWWKITAILKLLKYEKKDDVISIEYPLKDIRYAPAVSFVSILERLKAYTQLTNTTIIFKNITMYYYPAKLSLYKTFISNTSELLSKCQFKHKVIFDNCTCTKDDYDSLLDRSNKLKILSLIDIVQPPTIITNSRLN
ncbi:hypothetical protein NEOKW01_1067 [Nematocida sp. AWRm80]|nr:hypothetical protein NEOKW01_1067 [Nematocida sp. AWRm80]